MEIFASITRMNDNGHYTFHPPIVEPEMLSLRVIIDECGRNTVKVKKSKRQGSKEIKI